MKRHATSPFVLFALTIHVPSMAGTPAAATAVVAAGAARKANGSPRARRYSPDRRPFSIVASSVDAY